MDYNTLSLNKVNSSSVTTPAAFSSHLSSRRGFRTALTPYALRNEVSSLYALCSLMIFLIISVRGQASLGVVDDGKKYSEFMQISN